MAVHHYIDNEPASGEWTSKTETGGSTITRSADAAFPERGDYGLRVVTTGGTARVEKTVSISIAPGGDLFIGFWYCHRADPGAASYAGLLAILDGASFKGYLLYRSPLAYLRIYAYNDAGGVVSERDYTPPPTDRWSYVVARFHRAATDVSADGYGALYVDGVLTAQTANLDNFDRLDAVDTIRLGEYGWNPNGYEADYDEFKIADAYPEPFAAAPADEYPCAERTCVLYRQASADSREFADYCVAQLGVPRANLVRLDNATANETLADYATFQTEVETDLAAYLALHPTIAARASCFLIGYGVPGYFTVGGVRHSAASRLMNYGTGFSSATDNPLYNPGTVARLTRTDLGGKYLAARIDADSLANARAVIDAAAVVAAIAALPDSDTLYSDDSTYRACLACRKLRIVTAALGTYASDAFVWGDAGDPAFGSAGSRVGFVDDSASAASGLRSAAAACAKAILTGGYAAALGAAETADGFDAEAFFEMLRIGGTFAEAVAVAVEHIDYTAVPVGSPLMAVAFEAGGYNIYRGAGSADAIDWDTPVGHVRPGVATIDLVGLGHVADAKTFYGVRAVSSAGVEEANTDRIVRVIRDGAGDLVGPPPNRVYRATARAAAAGKVRLDFTYSATGERAAATGVQVAPVVAGQADWGSIIQTISVSGTRHVSTLLNPTWSDGQIVRLAVRAVTAAGATGPETELEPAVADAVAPADVNYLAAGQTA